MFDIAVLATILILLISLLLHWDAVKQKSRATDLLREAGDAYTKAVHEREEAHRVLAHVTRIADAAPISEEKETSP